MNVRLSKSDLERNVNENGKTTIESSSYLHFVNFVAGEVQPLLLFVENEYVTMVTSTFHREGLQIRDNTFSFGYISVRNVRSDEKEVSE